MDTLGYLIGAAILIYLARLMTLRHARQPGESLVFALVIVTAVFHAGRFVARMASLSRPTIVSTTADVIAFGALALLPALLLHAHLVIAVAALADTPSIRLSAIRDVLRRWAPLLVGMTYAPLGVLPFALYQVATQADPDPLARLSGFERPFVIWILWAHVVSMFADLVLSRHTRRREEGRLFFAVGLCFALNASLFVATFLLGGRHVPRVGEALVALSLLSSIAPACVFAYFVYRYNALGLIVRRSVVAAVGAGLVLIAYVFALRQVSEGIEAAYGVDSRGVEAVLLGMVMLAGAPFAGRVRDVVVRTVFPDLARQRSLSRDVGASLHRLGDRHAVRSRISSALTATFQFDRAELLFRESGDPIFSLIPGRSTALVRAEVADGRLAAAMDERRALAVVPIRQRSDTPPAALLIVGHSPAWPLTSAGDAAPLVDLGAQIANALDHVAVIEANVALDRQLQQERHLATIGRLAATIAHEVKNPLGAIKTIVQVMQEQQPDDRDLQMIVSEVDRLAGTVNQLLVFARMQDRDASSALAPSTSPGGDAAAAATKVARLFRPEAATRGAVLDVSIDDRLEACGACAAGIATDQLSEVLSNLIVNALQADARRILLCGSLTEGPRGRRVRLVVEDDGSGIPASQHTSVFEPFFTTRQRGTGLGLAIVRQRVRTAGGTITLESPVTSEGHGTRFVIELPVSAVEPS